MKDNIVNEEAAVADDIVTRLRGDYLEVSSCLGFAYPTVLEAADEIKRLRAVGNLLEDAFAQTWGNCWCHDPEIEPLVVRAFAAWQEARRG